MAERLERERESHLDRRVSPSSGTCRIGRGVELIGSVLRGNGRGAGIVRWWSSPATPASGRTSSLVESVLGAAGQGAPPGSPSSVR